MDNFYIVTNTLKDEQYRITREIKAYMREHKKRYVSSKKDRRGHIIPGTVPKGMDCALVLGGDGTFTRAARELAGYNIPLLGINMGTLGYLTEVELPDYKEALNTLFYGEPMIEERMMMTGEVPGRTRRIAMNDIVVAREGSLRIIRLDVYVNGELLNTYKADGVIISTPTGTTGYNLSAGGPIVEPTARMLVVTPICSHALNTRSIVFSAEDTIEIEIGMGRYGRVERASVAFDGVDRFSMHSGERIVIQKAVETTKLVKLSRKSFMEIMREKMKGN